MLIVKVQSIKNLFWLNLSPPSLLQVGHHHLMIRHSDYHHHHHDHRHHLIIIGPWSDGFSGSDNDVENLKLGQGHLVHLVRVILVQQIFHLKHNSD